MSSDDGWILRRNKAGKYVLQHYFASADNYPDVEQAKYVFDDLEAAVLKYQEFEEVDYPSEYRLSVQI